MRFQQEIRKQCDPCRGHRHPPQCKHPLPGKGDVGLVGPAGAMVAGCSTGGVGDRHKSGPALPQTLISAARHGGQSRRDVIRAGATTGGDKGPTGAGLAPLGASRPCGPSVRLLSLPSQPAAWPLQCLNRSRLLLPRPLAPLSHKKQLWGLTKNK